MALAIVLLLIVVAFGLCVGVCGLRLR